VKASVTEGVNAICGYMGCEITDLNVEGDHVDLVVLIPPKLAISDVMGVRFQMLVCGVDNFCFCPGKTSQDQGVHGGYPQTVAQLCCQGKDLLIVDPNHLTDNRNRLQSGLCRFLLNYAPKPKTFDFKGG
jgi:hypothetical protein